MKVMDINSTNINNTNNHLTGNAGHDLGQVQKCSEVKLVLKWDNWISSDNVYINKRLKSFTQKTTYYHKNK